MAGHYACRNYDDLLEKGHTFLFFEGEKYKDDNHAWDDEMVGTEYREAQPRDNQSGYTAGMIFLPKPVVGEDSRKHGGQHEVQSFSCGMFGLLVCWFMLGLFCRFLLQKCCKFELFY